MNAETSFVVPSANAAVTNSQLATARCCLGKRDTGRHGIVSDPQIEKPRRGNSTEESLNTTGLDHLLPAQRTAPGFLRMQVPPTATPIVLRCALWIWSTGFCSALDFERTMSPNEKWDRVAVSSMGLNPRRSKTLIAPIWEHAIRAECSRFTLACAEDDRGARSQGGRYRPFACWSNRSTSSIRHGAGDSLFRADAERAA